jgi:hypothetical protein
VTRDNEPAIDKEKNSDVQDKSDDDIDDDNIYTSMTSVFLTKNELFYKLQKLTLLRHGRMTHYCLSDSDSENTKNHVGIPWKKGIKL